MNALQVILATVEPGASTRDHKAIEAYLRTQGFKISRDSFSLNAHWDRYAGLARSGRGHRLPEAATMFFYDGDEDRPTALFVLGSSTNLTPGNLAEIRTAIQRVKAGLLHAESLEPQAGADYLCDRFGIEQRWHHRIIEDLEHLRAVR